MLARLFQARLLLGPRLAEGVDSHERVDNAMARGSQARHPLGQWSVQLTGENFPQVGEYCFNGCEFFDH
jgi:hypothetical protein